MNFVLVLAFLFSIRILPRFKLERGDPKHMSQFLAPYQAYVASRTDAPMEFGHAAGLMALSTIALGRRWLNNGLHPNCFFMLVGPSSRDRKSHSINLIMDLIQDIEPDRIGPSDFTPEGIMFTLRKKPGKKPRNKIIVALPEFGNHLATAGKSYASGLGSMLCQLYDGDTIVRQRSGKKPMLVKHPRFNMLAGCAYGMMEKYASPVDWEGGFFARIAFVKGETRPPPYLALPAIQTQARDAMRITLMDLRDKLEKQPGAMVTDPAAMALYTNYVKSVTDTDDEPAIVAQRERLLNSVMKWALLYQIDEDEVKPIGVAAMDKAIGFASRAYVTFKDTLTRCVGSSSSKLHRKVWKFISDTGDDGATRRAVLRRFNLNSDELARTIESLIQIGAIAKEATSNGGTSFVYVASVPFEGT